MRRRKFIALLGGAPAAWPLVARAQQAVTPMVGLLGGVAPENYERFVSALLQGLKEAGFVDGENVNGLSNAGREGNLISCRAWRASLLDAGSLSI